jgi:4-diphosphocytidyl-2-C-methyl-D-erythritol kinase
LYEDAESADRAAQAITLGHPEWWVHAGTLS